MFYILRFLKISSACALSQFNLNSFSIDIIRDIDFQLYFKNFSC